MARYIRKIKRSNAGSIEPTVSESANVDAGNTVDTIEASNGGDVSEDTGNNVESDTWKSTDDAFIDPSTVASISSGDTDSPKRGRGRPRGTSSTGRKGKASQTSANLEAILFSLHMMGASFLGVPELIISDDESKMLATAINRVSELYDVSIIPEKTMAFINLGIAACTVYGPRVIVVMGNKKKKQPKMVQQNPVTPIDAMGSGIARG